MGLHTGVAEESEGDYFGPPVNRVARLMSTGHGGQILLSDPTYNLVRDALAHMEPESELSYLGEHRLKDLRYTERIFQLIVPDLPKEFPPLKTHGLVTPEEIINLDRRYRRIRYIGGGGFGHVYLVRHEALERDMALKVLGRQYAEDEQFKERFKREAKSAAALNHPNIIQVHDAGEGIFEDQKVSYIAMEYAPGGTLEDLIAQQGGPLPARTATEVTLEVAKALEAAHRSGVIHRDIKPQNILLTESGEAKVADFGIARATASSTKLTRTGLLMGTLHYMSPEQANGKPASPRSDLYSLGVVLYQMLTGQLPFDAETPAAIMIKHITEPLRPPKEANLDVPEGINEVCVRLLAKDPNERYPDAGALIKDLERLKDDPQAVVSDTGPTVPTDMAPTILDDLQETRDDTRAPSTVEVPDLVRQELPQARSRLDEAGLSVGSQSEAPSETVPEGEIIEQEPPAGTEVEASSWVNVTVSSGFSTVEVPDLAGLNRSAASGTLAAAGLKLGDWNEAPNDNMPEGEIIGQEPAAGTKAKRGDPVRVTISSGSKEAVTTPDVSYMRPTEGIQDRQQEPKQAGAPPSGIGPHSRRFLLIGWGALGAMLAGVVLVAGPVLAWVVLNTTDVDRVTALFLILVVVACAGILAGLVGLHVRQAPSYGRRGKAGFVTAFVGITLWLVTSLDWWLAVSSSSARPLPTSEIIGRVSVALGFLIGFLILSVGFVLLGNASRRARVLPSWCGGLIAAFPVTPILAIVVFAVLEDNGVCPIDQSLVLSLPAVGFVLLPLGYVLWSRRGVSTGQSLQRRGRLPGNVVAVIFVVALGGVALFSWAAYPVPDLKGKTLSEALKQVQGRDFVIQLP